MNIPIFFQKSPLVSFCLAFVAGILLQQFFHFPALILLVIAAVALIPLWRVSHDNRLITLLIVMTVVCGGLRLSIVQYDEREKREFVSGVHQREVEVSGEVREIRQMERGYRYLVEVDGITSDSLKWRPDNFRIQVYSEKGGEVVVGGGVMLRGEMMTIRGPRNPGDFNFKTFYERKNIWANVYLAKGVSVETAENNTATVIAWIEAFRQWARRLFHGTVGGDAARLMTALIIGLREEIPSEIRQDFADTGVIHVLAVSGLHVGYVLIIIMALAKLIRIPYRWDKVAIIAALMFYAIITGGRASVWRAVLMASLYVAAPLFQRNVSLWNILAASALTLLLVSPNYLFDVGFLLSYSAVISIVFFYSQIDSVLPEKARPSNIRNPLVRGTFALVIVTASAQMGTIPFTWSFFHRIPIISMVANVLIVPVIGLIVSIGFAILLIGSWLPFVGDAFGNSAWFLSEVTFALTRFFSDLPFAYLDAGTPSTVNLIQYGLFIAALFLMLRRLLWKGAIALTLAANLFIWPWALHHDVMDVIFLDVGQGDAAVLHVPTEDGVKTILVDVGPKTFTRDAGEKVVVPVLKYLRVDTVDLLVMSHPHSDHIGGVEALLDAVPVKEIWDTFSDYDSRLYQAIRNRIEEGQIIYRRVGAGELESRFDPAQLYLLHPDSLWAIHERNVNNISIVMKITYGESSYLFVGDLEREGDRETIAFTDQLDTDVLKVGHHGSITSSTQPLLDLITPNFAVVSVGDRNKFNHPSALVMERVRDSGAQVLRTDLEGAVWFKSDGRRIWRHEWR